jgi:hypothetical protein
MRLVGAFVALAAAAAFADDVPSAEAIRAARDGVYADPRFHYAPPRPRSFLEDLYEALAAWVRDHPTTTKWVAGLLGLLFVVIVVHIVWTLRMAREPRWTLEDADADLLRSGDPAAFRARAVASAGSGRFEDAVRELYAALLLVLERRGSVVPAPSKALLDYRMEAARDAQGVRTLELFAGVYHPGSFGRRPPDRRRFDELLAAFDRLAGSAA